MNAVKRCEELIEQITIADAGVAVATEDDTTAIRQILDERVALIAAWPVGWCVGCVALCDTNGKENQWVANILGAPVFPTREAAVLAAAGIEREVEG
jgi:hypothetical protein